MIRRFHPGPRYSEMTVHRGVAYLAGQVPDDAAADMATQTAQVLAAIDARLAEAGTDRSQILMASVYLASMSDYAEFNRVWDAWLDGVAGPPRATVQAALADPRWKIEIVVTAAAPDPGP